MTSPSSIHKISRTPEGPKGFLLFHRRRSLPESVKEELIDASAITGIHLSELQMRFIGTGIGALTVNQPIEELNRCAADLKAIGLKTAVVEKDLIKKSRLPVAAKKVYLSASSMDFEDAKGETLFQINGRTDLLIIITDLSGQSVRQLMTAMTYTGNVIQPGFEESLKKISIARPAAIFYALHDDSVTGVYVDSDTFSFLGLNDHLTIAKGTNFRVMITKAMSIARSCITDDNFGLSLLPGASPDWNGGKSAIEQELGRYARYIITAARNTLIPGEPDTQGGNPADGRKQNGASLSDDTGDVENINHDFAERLIPPPDMNDSKIVNFFQTSLPEIIVGLIVLTTPFSLFMSGIRAVQEHHRFWQAAVGISVLVAGFLMFFYALLMLYYRRMVENTPTSKIRSFSMGMVELCGKTRRYHDLRASATQTPCVFYTCRYYKFKNSGDGGRWALTRSVSSGKIPFYIEDETGRVLINPRGAVFNISMTSQTFTGSYIPALSMQLHDPNTKVVESLIPPGVRVYVFGSAQIERRSSDTRTKVIDKLRLLKQNPEALSAYDTDGDGQIDVNEWEVARNDATTQVYAECLADASANLETVVIEKPRFGLLPFIVADSEKGLIRQLMFRTVVFLIGGLMTIGFSVRFLVDLFS
ncbi:MAG: hypothetical protein C4518_11850 [Desulfobacteraceae bacterium]|nr:MAG: hypothetical protein C4518_11850 [Desulfobacteraceae bacterium]